MRKRDGFSLVEVVMALGLVSFVLVAIMGLFSIGLTGTRDSQAGVDAANLAVEILNKRLAAPTNAIPALGASAFSLPPIDAAGAPVQPQWTTYPNPVGPGGYATSVNAEGAYKLHYAVWRDTTSFGADSKLLRVSVILSSPYDASLTNASSRFEATGSWLAP